MERRITILRVRRPVKETLNEDLQWFGSSLGLFGLRDRDKSCFRVFIELLKTGRTHDSVTSDELAYRLRLSRGTVVHHLHKLMESGIVVHEKKGYLLRAGNLEAAVEELEKDLNRMLEDLQHIARNIDEKLQ